MSGIERTSIVKQTKTVNLWRVLYIFSLLYLNKNVIFVYAYILLHALWGGRKSLYGHGFGAFYAKDYRRSLITKSQYRIQTPWPCVLIQLFSTYQR